MSATNPAEVLAETMVSVARDPKLNYGIEALRLRRAEFSSESELLLTGVAAVPEARQMLEDRLDEAWSACTVKDEALAEEVVIGAGVHAAIYCAARVQRGLGKPLVLERDRVGGAFAVSRNASFYLNSRNRPGPLGAPGENGSLNYLPGAVIQPANLSHKEFQTNADLAFVVRATLAQFGRVRTGATVRTVTTNSDATRPFVIELAGGSRVRCDRVIDARGSGDPIGGDIADDATIRTFQQLMAAQDRPFPLGGLKRVAVVGGGDAARCAVETFLGIGPSVHMSSAALDYVEAIDWYAPDLPTSCEQWRADERGRYQGIGSSLTVPASGRPRLRVFNEFGRVSRAFGGAYVNELLYDCAVVATGLRRQPLGGVFLMDRKDVGSMPVIARQYGGLQAYAIGPRAAIPFTDLERSTPAGEVAANVNAVFRYAGRTAALATRLPRTEPAF